MAANAPRFCSACGSALVPDARFCASCGNALSAAPPVDAAPPVPTPPPLVAAAPAPAEARPGSSFALTTAGVLCYLWAAVFGVVVLAQFGIGIANGAVNTGLLGVWNSLIVLLYIFIGYGITRRNPKAYSWGLGTNVLNAGFGLYQLVEQQTFFNLFLLPLELAIVIILLVNRRQFQAGAGEVQASSVMTAPVTPMKALLILVLGLGVPILATTGLWKLGIWNGGTGAQPSAAPSDAKPSGGILEQARAAADEERAISAAKTLVINNLAAPATAQWVSSRVVDHYKETYIVHVVVDAQNKFGALLRNSFLACVKLGDGNHFTYNTIYGLQESTNPPNELEVELLRTMEKWPGHGEPTPVPTAAVALASQPVAPAEPIPTASASCLSYEPTLVTMKGMMRRKTFPGAPNFEDVAKGDEAETGFYLELTEPVCVNASSDGEYPGSEGIKDVQLLLDKQGYDRLRPSLDSEVTLSGTLSPSMTGHHHAPLLLNVKP